VSRGWLSGLLRARQVQEDVARQRLAGAQLDAISARRTVVAEDERIETLNAELPSDTALAFVAAAAARQAAAATWAAARLADAAAADQVTIAETAVIGAARHRRSAEKLDERIRADEQYSARTKEQNALDEFSTGGVTR